MEDLPRGDVAAAVEFYKRKTQAGEWRRELGEYLYMLMDTDEQRLALERELAALSGA